MIKHVIIQAGGRGSRLEHFTYNKPKALVSVNGEPLILNQMKLFPNAKHYIIADYKRDVLEKYLKLYAPTDYVIIPTSSKQTSSGIKDTLKLIPPNESILILWCDLYFKKNNPFDKLEDDKNYIGLSVNFKCRWRFVKGTLEEAPSIKRGIAGVFVFKDKNELADIKDGLEFCRFLKNKDIKFSPLSLKDAYEVGTLDNYGRVIKNYINARPFNSLTTLGNKIIKVPTNAQGKKLAKYEINWYKKVEKFMFDFLPKVHKFYPLTLEKVDGRALFMSRLSDTKEKKIINRVVDNLKKIHTGSGVKKGSWTNSYEALLGKTLERVDSVASLIPQIDSDFIIINGKKCRNFYKKWKLVEKMMEEYLYGNYVLIHGDPTFSNILHAQDKVYFIDPRGYYGKKKFYGDEDYDWAKVYYSMVGNYDQFNLKNFILKIDTKNITLEIRSNGWEKHENLFFDLIQRDRRKIKLIHALIWLSLTTYAWDNYDSICAAFYNGIYLMQEIYETSH
jgi:GTP:adenosylcobinamide-phosphate guanylyltransferase